MDNSSFALFRCRQQQSAWSTLSVRERLRPLRALRHLLFSERDRLCSAVAQDIGKTAVETLSGDILPLADACRFLEQEAPRLLRPRRVPLRHRPLWLWGQCDTVHRRPRGVVGLIGTWNYPLFINGVPLVQALTAGNGVLWKPSEVAPASASLLFQLLLRAGYPQGLVHLLPATREAGKELAEAAVDHIVFVGSSTTGRKLAVTLAQRLTSSTMELSGCDAFFILDDADADFAARAAWFGATINRGQTCIAARRAFVPRTLYSAFTAALEPLANKSESVALALPAQQEQADRLVQGALADGARLLPARSAGREGEAPAEPDSLGSAARQEPRPPLLEATRSAICAPAAILDAHPEMAVCQEASFAPLLAVLPYDTVEDALRLDAHCSYGLGASIFTSNPERAKRLASQLRAGMVTINDVVVPTAHPATPFGGRGESGWGVTQGAEGLLGMTVPQVVSVRSGKFRPHYDMTDKNDASQMELALALLQHRHAASWKERCRGWMRLVAALWKAK